METFRRTIEIAAPPDRVWAVMSDVVRWHEWTPSIRRIRLFGETLAVGRRALVFQPKLPPALWTVTDLQPGRAFTWVSVAPGVRVRGVHVTEPLPTGGARATVAIEIEGLFARPWARLTRAITERYLEYEAQGLKRRCETASGESARA